MSFTPSGSQIKSIIRRRIIMHTGGTDLLLHEGKLATEFGVSRTPIRQVIQSLAAEWLVEVRSGVGTIATPIVPARRVQDFRSFASILRSCADCATSQSLSKVVLEITALRMLLEQTNAEMVSEGFFEAAQKFLDCLTELVDDNILRDALIACFWRYIRREIAVVEGDLSLAVKGLLAIVKDAEYGAQSGDAERTLQMISGAINDKTKRS